MFLSCLTKPLIKNFAARFESGGTASAATLEVAEQLARLNVTTFKVIAAPIRNACAFLALKKFPR